MRSLVSLILAVMTTLSAHAADRYVRPGATGNGSGTDWTNAYSKLPASLNRGDTYWIASGNYGTPTFRDPPAGTSVITLKKATAGSHGTNTGWNNSYGDGQATFGYMTFHTGYYTIDGTTRNEGNWADSASYGIRNTGRVHSSSLECPGASCADNLTIRYMDIGGPVGSGLSSASTGGLYLGGFGNGSQACANWTLQSSHLHNSIVQVMCAGCSGLLIENTLFGFAWGKEAIRGSHYATNLTIRNNVFKDSCQVDPREGGGSTCTAEIAIWDSQTAGAFDGNQIYGNVFQKTTNEMNTGGVIVVGGNGSSWVGTSASNTVVANNTIVGYKQGVARVIVNGGSNNSVVNNVWFDNSAATGCSASNCGSNTVFASSPFVGYPGNLTLAAPTAAGVVLGAAYSSDARGMLRGKDGLWDQGAYEFGSTGQAVLAPPTGLSVK
jgi:hypothetical protein